MEFGIGLEQDFDHNPVPNRFPSQFYKILFWFVLYKNIDLDWRRIMKSHLI